MQPTDYYNINDLKELYHSGDPNAALYEEVPREGMLILFGRHNLLSLHPS